GWSRENTPLRLSAFCFRFFLFRSFRSSLSSLPDLIRQSMRKRNLHSAFHRALAPRERESISYSPRARGEVRLPTGPARSGRPDDKLRNPGEGAVPASLRSPQAGRRSTSCGPPAVAGRVAAADLQIHAGEVRALELIQLIMMRLPAQR